SGGPMKILAVTAVSVIVLVRSATAQSALPPGPNVGVLPPLEYDYPYPGKLEIVRAGKEEMALVCPRTAFNVTLGCAYRYNAFSHYGLLGKCRIVIATDDILRSAGWPYDVVFRHERGHCENWPNHHPGARPIGSPEGKAPEPKPLDKAQRERIEQLKNELDAFYEARFGNR